MSNYLSLFRGGAVACVAVLALTSCATLNEEECRTADWYTLGQQDGAAGKAEGHLNEHRRACADHKLPVDDGQWRTGWEQGIRLYCTPENGLLEGRRGNYYANSCPIELKTGFESAYSVSKKLSDARSSRDSVQREIDSLNSKLRKAEKPEDRRRIEGEIDSKRYSLRTAERRIWEAEGDYDVYIASHGLMSRR